MLAKIMITRKLVQCAKEKKLLVKEISKNPNTEIEGKLSESLVTYLCTTDKVKKIISGTLILGGKAIRSDILSKTDGFVRHK